ncbi:hypothetical protein EXN66_Car001396 [Channa argus]|uniref:Uncharacterized protein n=1 Tax=Channa argus TaxID=215402 RepID=A0A6G1QZZ2_CHAAH|nr:hypothetical protein EXN66_Car001396 [Channa argus]
MNMPLHQISVIPRDVPSSRVSGSGKAKDKQRSRSINSGDSHPPHGTISIVEKGETEWQKRGEGRERVFILNADHYWGPGGMEAVRDGNVKKCHKNLKQDTAACCSLVVSPSQLCRVAWNNPERDCGAASIRRRSGSSLLMNSGLNEKPLGHSASRSSNISKQTCIESGSRVSILGPLSLLADKPCTCANRCQGHFITKGTALAVMFDLQSRSSLNMNKNGVVAPEC